MGKTKKEDIIPINQSRSIFAEAYKVLKKNIEFSSPDSKVQTIVVTSANHGEGKTTTAVNLAVNLAKDGYETILIDCDLREANIHKVFDLPNDIGLSEVLVGKSGLSRTVYKTGINGLYVLTSGSKPPNPAGFLASIKMQNLLKYFKKNVDYIIMDTPPVGVFSDAKVLSQYADGCVFVVAKGETNKNKTAQLMGELKKLDINILGVVLNKANLPFKEYIKKIISRTRNALVNISSNVLQLIVTSAVGLVLPGMFIRHYGSSVNGLISSIKQFLACLSIVEGGVWDASTAVLYKPIEEGNTKKVNSILSATRHFYIRSGIIFTLLLILLSVLYPLSVKKEVSFGLAFTITLILGSTGVIEYFILGKYKVFLSASQKVYIVTFAKILSILCGAVISVVLIYLEYDVVTVQIAGAMMIIINIIIILLYTKRSYPQVNFKTTPDKDSINQRWSALIQQISGFVILNSPIITITLFLGLTEVSVYSIYNMIFGFITALVVAFTRGLVAGFGELLAISSRGKIIKAFSLYEHFYYAILTWGYACASVLILSFIEVYTSGIKDVNYIRPDTAVLFVIAGIVSAIRKPANTLVNAAGHYKQTQLISILEAVINIAVSLVLVNFIGLNGILIGLILSGVYRTTDLIIYTSNHILQISPKGTFKKIIFNFFLAAIVVVPFMLFVNIQASNYLQWFKWAVLVGGSSFIIIFGGNFLMDRESSKDILHRLRLLIKKR